MLTLDERAVVHRVARTPTKLGSRQARNTSAYHQQPDVNYIQVLEKVDFPCTAHAQRVPF